MLTASRSCRAGNLAGRSHSGSVAKPNDEERSRSRQRTLAPHHTHFEIRGPDDTALCQPHDSAAVSLRGTSCQSENHQALREGGSQACHWYIHAPPESFQPHLSKNPLSSTFWGLGPTPAAAGPIVPGTGSAQRYSFVYFIGITRSFSLANTCSGGVARWRKQEPETSRRFLHPPCLAACECERGSPPVWLCRSLRMRLVRGLCRWNSRIRPASCGPNGHVHSVCTCPLPK